MASRSIARADPFGWTIFWARFAALILLLLFCLPAHLLWRAFRRPSPWPRMFLAGVARIAGARVSVSGRRVGEGAVYVANHVSWIDIPVLAGATGAAFVAHDGVARAPVVGWLASLNNTIFVARTERRTVGGQVEALRAGLLRRQPVAFFPEGTTTDGRGLLPFKPSLFAGLTPPPRPLMVQPVLIDYGPDSAAVAWVGDEPGGDNAVRVMKRRGGFRIRLVFLDPFDPAALGPGGSSWRKAVAAEARLRIHAALSASLGRSPPV